VNFAGLGDESVTGLVGSGRSAFVLEREDTLLDVCDDCTRMRVSAGPDSGWDDDLVPWNGEVRAVRTPDAGIEEILDRHDDLKSPEVSSYRRAQPDGDGAGENFMLWTMITRAVGCALLMLLLSTSPVPQTLLTGERR
jgi:hypothetical protein